MLYPQLLAAVLIYEAVHLLAEFLMKRPPGGRCNAVVIMPTRGDRDLGRFAGYVDFVVVDSEAAAERAEAAGLRWVLNKYRGKSGALATALETIDADLYVFIDDDAYPGEWIGLLKGMCGRFATAYRWVLDRLQNAFSLGGFDWMVWPATRFLYGGAMTVPAARRADAIEALKKCPVDDMALTALAERIEVLPLLIPMDPAEGTWEFSIRQAVAAKLGNLTLWAVELIYYWAWTIFAFFFPPLFAVHAVRTALRSRRTLGEVDWLQVLLSPIERPLQAAIFLASAFKRCFTWRGAAVCKKCRITRRTARASTGV
ncbi:glycosyltransferase family 2 protein [Pyrobaculum aerophilum]|uniref:glycosyltransferase family 2 protein n=1 Tax=Pyrobaculum aerophilum TaxID=13773 RepID=UPI002FD9FBC8